nr:PEP-CTERM sorting domain-containing protein [uncultured Desulfobulbus sp.]
MKKSFQALAVALGLTVIASAAQADIIYVGSWQVDDGPSWGTYTASTADALTIAAMLFGGNSSDYAISTVGSDPNTIDHLAWYNGWGSGDSTIAAIEPNGQGSYPAGSRLAETTIIDVNGNGIFDESGDYSCYVTDWAVGDYYKNYVFRITDTPVPEPTTMLLFGTGIAALTAFSRKRIKK